MEIRLYNKDRLRIKADTDGDNFINVSTDVNLESLTVDIYPIFHYIEMRLKNDTMQMFLFKKKSHKKHYDFGYFKDAEVVYSLNKVIHK